MNLADEVMQHAPKGLGFCCLVSNFEVLYASKIYKFCLQLCSMGSIFPFSSFNCWIQFLPFVQSNKMDVQGMVIAWKEASRFPFNSPLT
jgi:hypothetical protein